MPIGTGQCWMVFMGSDTALPQLLILPKTPRKCFRTDDLYRHKLPNVLNRDIHWTTGEDLPLETLTGKAQFLLKSGCHQTKSLSVQEIDQVAKTAQEEDVPLLPLALR